MFVWYPKSEWRTAAIDARRAYLKQLASRVARTWGSAPLPPRFAGETQVETRNTVYELRDGVCHSATRREDASATRAHQAELFGMRLVGWVTSDEPSARIALEWRRGAHAVLWRPRRGGERHSVIALTSATLRFRTV